MMSAWNRLGALMLLPVLVMLAALASGCGGSADAEAENNENCGCCASSGQQDGTLKSKAALKQFLLESAAKHPEGSEMREAYRRALARFSELEAVYADDSLTPDDRSRKAHEKMAALMWQTDTNENETQNRTGNQP